MSDSGKGTSISILDKDYVVNCPEDERDALHQAADLLNDKMNELKSNSKVVGTERIAVMAALNMAHEMLQSRRDNKDYNSQIGDGVKRIEDKIKLVLHSVAS